MHFNAVQSSASMGRLLTLLTMVAVLSTSGCIRALKLTGVESVTESAEAVDNLRGAYAAFNRGDIAATVEPLDPQIEWTEPAEFPGGGTYHGREEVKRYLTQSRAAWAEASSEPERFITSGNRMVVFVHARVRAKDSKQWQDVRLADVYRCATAKRSRCGPSLTGRQRYVGLESKSRVAELIQSLRPPAPSVIYEVE